MASSIRRIAPLLLALVAAPVSAQEAETPASFGAVEDPARAINGAVERAEKEHQRVLVLLGREGNPDTLSLAEFIEKDPEVRRKILYEYQLVKVLDDHRDAMNICEAVPGVTGTPHLTVLDGNRKVLANLPTPDRKKLAEFLDRWKAPPVDARAVLKEALAEAGKTKRKVLVHVGAPW